jgi:purine-nucleoside phosphorylase
MNAQCNTFVFCVFVQISNLAVLKTNHTTFSMPSPLMQQLAETTNYIKSIYPHQPEIGIILGSGLGNFVQEIKVEEEIPYSNIPHFPVSTVAGHSGNLILGELNGKRVAAMAGRFHYYEGYTPQQVAYPVRVMKMLGIHTLLLSNAAGAVNTSFEVGDLMIIKDHISFFTVNPLIGKNEEELGTRFPDMSEPYNKTIIAKAKQIAEKCGLSLKEGIYTAVTGPTFETHAEYRLIKAIGGDAVGMSTVQEVITAVHAGLKVFAISVVTDLGIREEDNVITHGEVLAAAKDAEPKLTMLFKELVAVL